MSVLRLAPLTLACCFAACGNASPAPRAPGPLGAPTPSGSVRASSRPPEAPDGVVPKLRTGALEPIDDPTVHDLHVIGRDVSDGYETLAAELPEGILAVSHMSSWGALRTPVRIDFPPGQPTPAAFLGVPFLYGEGERDEPGARPQDVVWIRRAVSASLAPVTGALFDSANLDEGTPGAVHHFRVASAQAVASDPKTRRQWLRALAAHVMTPLGTSWGAFSAARLRAIAAAHEPASKKKAAALRSRPMRSSPPGSDLGTLMETTTGATAIQEALQTDRPLFALAAREPANIPVATLKGPSLASHPWEALLTRSGAPPAERLAVNVPAEFYYVRASDLPSLYHLLDEVDAWGTPAASVLDGAFEERALAARYEAELALKRGPLTRALGSAVVGEVALVGSDPYVKEGSDVTVLLQVKSRSLFDAALAATLVDLEMEHGSLVRSKREHAGVEVSVARSSDGAVAQQRATVGDVEIVSNSANAMDVVLDTYKGLHPRLIDEPDFRFMLARDAHTQADVLGYMGDRFVGAVVGPKQKVLEARRQMALSELTTPGFAALLYGWMQGKSPAKLEDLFSTSLLAKSDMVHAAGGPIAWRPGDAARSSWGTPAALTPLIDLPAPQTVTASERAGYDWFARGYEFRWSAYIDPIAVRIAFAPREGRETMTVDVRELPLIDGTQYREAADFVGDARFTAPPPAGGVRAVVGIGREAWPRRELGNTLKGFSAHEINFDWIGQWASIGLMDRANLASALLTLSPEDVPQKPERRSERNLHGSDETWVRTIAGLPVYAQIAVKGAAQAALALAGARVIANETLPGMLDWGESERYRDVPLVRVHVKKEAASLVGEGSSIDFFYAVTRDAITLTLQDWVLRRLVDEALDGKAPAASTDAGAAQVSFSFGSDPGKGLWTALAWLAEQETAREQWPSASRAMALLVGAPEIANDAPAQRSLALAYLGAIPVTPDGSSFVLAKDGVRDPLRGTPCAPSWPDVPVPGSALAKVLQSLAALRTEIGFDDEGKDGDRVMRSLHARAVFDLR